LTLQRTGAARCWPVWPVVLPIAAWALVRTLGWEQGSTAVAILAFTPYAAIAAFLVAGVAVALRNWAAAAVAVLATALLAVAVLPRAIGSETTPVDGHRTLIVLSANIHHGSADPEALVRLVERLHPQLLSIQELTPGFASALRADGSAACSPTGSSRCDPIGAVAASTRPCRCARCTRSVRSRPNCPG
jgi:endonuclease/exonuclease/phosphatase (EEP) superfamily protein YafD